VHRLMYPSRTREALSVCKTANRKPECDAGRQCQDEVAGQRRQSLHLLPVGDLDLPAGTLELVVDEARRSSTRSRRRSAGGDDRGVASVRADHRDPAPPRPPRLCWPTARRLAAPRSRAPALGHKEPIGQLPIGSERLAAISRESRLGSRSLLRGDAEGVDRHVYLHGGEGGLRRDVIGDRDRVIAAGELVVEEEERIALGIW
jgi:hypothetical protein